MPIEFGLWKLGEELTPVTFEGIETDRLESVLADDISVVDSGLLLIGRQVLTAFGKFIDLLALNSDGELVVVELKRDRTPREVIAQLLDYGSCSTAKMDELLHEGPYKVRVVTGLEAEGEIRNSTRGG